MKIFGSVVDSFLGRGGTDKAPILTLKDDPVVADAITKARETLPEFWRRYEDRALVAESFWLKIKRGTSYCWVAVTRRTASTAQGIVISAGVEHEGLYTGMEVSFSETEVVDWGYRSNGKVYGSFTTRALLTLGLRVDAADESELSQDPIQRDQP